MDKSLTNALAFCKGPANNKNYGIRLLAAELCVIFIFDFPVHCHSLNFAHGNKK